MLPIEIYKLVIAQVDIHYFSAEVTVHFCKYEINTRVVL